MLALLLTVIIVYFSSYYSITYYNENKIENEILVARNQASLIFAFVNQFCIWYSIYQDVADGVIPIDSISYLDKNLTLSVEKWIIIKNNGSYFFITDMISNLYFYKTLIDYPVSKFPKFNRENFLKPFELIYMLNKKFYSIYTGLEVSSVELPDDFVLNLRDYQIIVYIY